MHARSCWGRVWGIPAVGVLEPHREGGRLPLHLVMQNAFSFLTCREGCSESEDGQKGAEGGAAEVSLEEALMRLAEFLSVQLGAEESCGATPDLGKVSNATFSNYCFPYLCGPHIPDSSALVLTSFTAW